jgi:hypothetical protein
MNTPSFIVLDTLGNQFISDTGNNCVRRVNASGNITTVAGLLVSGRGDTCNTSSNATPTPAQGLLQPTGLAIDNANNLYIADTGHNCVRKLPANSVGASNLTVVAGTCTAVSTASATPAPSGLAADTAGNIYISIKDTEVLPAISNYQVLKLAAGTTTLCVVAGKPSVLVPTTCGGAANGVLLSAPSGLALDFNSNLYVADTGNNCVRQILGNATPTAFVGQCSNDNVGNPAATLHAPYGLFFSLVQSLFITESNPNNIVRYTPSTGALFLVAGLPDGSAGTYSTVQDGTSALNIPLNSPRGLVEDSSANFYVADSSNNIVRLLAFNFIFPTTPVNSPSATQPLTFTINQNVNLSFSLGPDYTATSTTCGGALSVAPSGSVPNTCQVFVRFTPTRPGPRNSALRITDSLGGTVSQGLQGVGPGALGIFASGIVNTVASSLASAVSVTTDSAGNAYVLEQGTGSVGTADLREIPAAGGASKMVIPPGAGLVTPLSIATDAAGNWYIADTAQGTVARFGADGSIDTNYVTGLVSPTAAYVDGFGNLYIAQGGTAHNVIEVYSSGPRRVVAGSGTDPAANGVAATTAKFTAPSGLTVDLNGVLYIADAGAHRVYAIDKTGLIHSFAGNGTTTTTTPGTALGTGLIAPTSIASDAAADIYIADQGANRIYSIFAAGSSIETVLGTGVAGNFGDGGPSTLAQVSEPLSVALDSSANAFVVDAGNKAVREITYPNPTLSFGTLTVGATSAPMLQSFSDVGTDSLNLTAPFSTSDSHFAVNAASTTCGTAILPGSVCAVGFTFTPTSVANYTATSILTSNAYDSPEPITLKGSGQQQLPSSIVVTGPTEVYGQSFPIVATINPGAGPAVTGTITYSVNGVTICSTTGTLSPLSTCAAGDTFLPVGSYPVTVTYSGDSSYAPSTSMTTLTVTPAPLAVTAAVVTRPYGQPNPTLTGTITGVAPGDTILASYTTTATTSSPVGSYPVTATLTTAGSTSLSNYTVTNTPGAVIVTQAALTVAVQNATRQYGTPNPTFSSTAAGTVNGDQLTFTYSTTATILSPVGTCPITATVGGAAAGNYSLTVTPGTLTVTPAPLTLTVANATRPYGTPNPTFTGTITGALNGDTFTTAYATTATINSPPGTYPITGTVSGSAAGNYTITIVPGTLTVTKATMNLNVAVNNVSRVYGAPNPTFTSAITGALNGDTFTITYATTATAASPVGTYTITPTVSGPATANYNITTSNGTLTITPAPLTIAANSATRAYGATNPTFTGTTTGLVNNDTVTVTYATPVTTASPVGTYPIVPTATGAALTNYTVTATNGTLTITPAIATVTIAVANATRIYGAANPIFTSTITGALNGDVLTASYSTTATPASPVGNYPIMATLTGSGAANYTATVVAGTLTVTPAPLSVTANNASRMYGTANPTFTGTINGLVNGDTVTTTYATTATIASPVGTYPIVPIVTGAALSNYTLVTSNGTLTITQAAAVATITVANQTRVYGAANPTLTGTVTGARNGDALTATYSTTATPASAVGTYPITATLTGTAAANYRAIVIAGTLTVTPAPLNVAAANATRPYGAANPAFTGTTTGLVNGDTVTTTYTTTATLASPAGTYPITPAVTGAALSNYTLVMANGTLTITPALHAATITVNNATRVYGTANPTFTGTVTGALNGDVLTATYSTTATTASPVGSYPITATLTGTNAANYTATVVPGTLSITPAPTTTVVVTSGTPSVFGTTVTFTATVTSTSGTPTGTMTFSDGATLLGPATLTATGVATFATSALTVGTHAINAAYGATTNFSASAGSVTQVVTSAVPTGVFTLTASPATQFIRGAGSTVYTVTVGSVASFTGPVALTCGGLPKDAVCAFATPQVTLTAGGTATTTMTVTTTTADARLIAPPTPRPTDLAPITAAAIFPMEFGGFGLMLAGVAKRKRKTGRLSTMRRLMLICLSVGVLGMAGCGCISTVYQTYTINITGTAVNANAPTQTTSVQLTVGLQ